MRRASSARQRAARLRHTSLFSSPCRTRCHSLQTSAQLRSSRSSRYENTSSNTRPGSRQPGPPHDAAAAPGPGPGPGPAAIAPRAPLSPPGVAGAARGLRARGRAAPPSRPRAPPRACAAGAGGGEGRGRRSRAEPRGGEGSAAELRGAEVSAEGSAPPGPSGTAPGAAPGPGLPGRRAVGPRGCGARGLAGNGAPLSPGAPGDPRPRMCPDSSCGEGMGLGDQTPPQRGPKFP